MGAYGLAVAWQEVARQGGTTTQSRGGGIERASSSSAAIAQEGRACGARYVDEQPEWETHVRSTARHSREWAVTLITGAARPWEPTDGTTFQGVDWHGCAIGVEGSRASSALSSRKVTWSIQAQAAQCDQMTTPNIAPAIWRMP
eukprot:7377342-Prymnesium_polylepis.3